MWTRTAVGWSVLLALLVQSGCESDGTGSSTKQIEAAGGMIEVDEVDGLFGQPISITEEISFNNQVLTQETADLCLSIETVRILHLDLCHVPEHMLGRLQTLPQLGWLSLQAVEVGGMEIGDEQAAEIAKIRSLKVLDLSYSSLTDVGLRQLAALDQLELLELLETYVSESGVRELLRLRPKLDIHYSITPSAEVRKAQIQLLRDGLYVFAEIEGNWRLVQDPIDANDIKIIIPEVVDENQPNERDWDGNAETLTALKMLCGSQEISLEFRSRNSNLFGAIETLGPIKQLKLSSSFRKMRSVSSVPVIPWKFEDFAKVGRLKGCQKLYLFDLELTALEFEEFAKMPDLKELEIDRMTLNTESLAALARCSALEHLKLKECSLTNSRFEGLAQIKTLKRLSLLDECEEISSDSITDLRKLRPDLIIDLGEELSEPPATE